MNIPYYHVDAFTEKIFAGNPAGVCLLNEWLPDTVLQKIAAENNLPETAFLVEDEGNFQLRWFSPAIEIDLCGHATLASAFVLHLVNQNMPQVIRFATRSGILTVEKQGNLFIMDFPARKAVACHPPEELRLGLGISPRSVLKARDFLAVFDTEEQIRSLAPDYEKLAALDCLGIIATAPGREVDFVYRFFAPAAGIPEDPVTGSSHCTLIPYWAEQMGKNKLSARQLSSRGGELSCTLNGDRVQIGGRAVLYQHGELSPGV
jgi:PhzF family phenazine biosynthesis protein